MFKRLRAKADNKVGPQRPGLQAPAALLALSSAACCQYRQPAYAATSPELELCSDCQADWRAGLLRLPQPQSHLELCALRRLHLPQLRGHPPQPGSPPELRQVRCAGLIQKALLPAPPSKQRVAAPTPKGWSQPGLSRSTNLDAWTKEQLKLMSVGGNARARTFFKEHGWDELGADKIPHKARAPGSAACIPAAAESDLFLCLQYQSRAAEMYRAQLVKDVAKAAREEAESAQDSALAAAPAVPSVHPPPSLQRRAR